MSKVDIKLNSAGFLELLTSPEVSELVYEYGEQVAANAGEGYEVQMFGGSWVAIAQVATATDEARKENLENNTLLMALGGIDGN